jgi:hypothetical protein
MSIVTTLAGLAMLGVATRLDTTSKTRLKRSFEDIQGAISGVTVELETQRELALLRRRFPELIQEGSDHPLAHRTVLSKSDRKRLINALNSLIEARADVESVIEQQDFTAEKQRKFEGVPALTDAQSRRRIAKLKKAGCKVQVVQTKRGQVVLRKCPPGV